MPASKPAVSWHGPVRDSIFHEQGHLVRSRTQPSRRAVLERNKQAEIERPYRDIPGARLMSSIPVEDFRRISEANPDFDAPDKEIREKARNKLLNSSEGRKYRVGTPSRCSVFIRNNPLAKDQ